ncbi:MAG: exo-alpha-sialidase [Planctomycetes bacterium]|nr:exo-alpha-sialidase [Planctomycetota bacterium]
MSCGIPQIVGISKVYDPGWHCAFTDIIAWRGRVWLVFREAVNHSVHPSSNIVVVASADHGRTFLEAGRISARGLDVRDPHFFVVDDVLHITIPCWRLPQERNEHVTIIARSDNGREWETVPDVKALEGLTVWRPRLSPDGTWYAAAYGRNADKSEGAVHLMKTTDGVDWGRVSTIETKLRPNETELCFDPDGTLRALVRREKQDRRYPLLAKAVPPYAEWSKLECDAFLQGPLLERLTDHTYVVVGRSPREPGQAEFHPCVTRMFMLDVETGHLEPGDALESGGDTSYAGFVRLPEGARSAMNGGHNALLSYYSGHGYDNGSYRGGEQVQRCAVYVARMAVPG